MEIRRRTGSSENHGNKQEPKPQTPPEKRKKQKGKTQTTKQL